MPAYFQYCSKSKYTQVKQNKNIINMIRARVNLLSMITKLAIYIIYYTFGQLFMETPIFVTTETGQFQITESVIGQGSFGCVYLAIDTQTKYKVAIKIVTPEHVDLAIKEVNILDRMNKQTRIRQQQNPEKQAERVLKFLGSYRDYNGFYIVTQFYGKPLSTFMSTLNTNDYFSTLKLFLAILKALQPLRSNKILHRDIKPENILLQINQVNQYEAKFCDFGLAAVEKQGKSSIIQTDRVGTLIYQAPQVIKMKQYSQKSQIWSLGIIFYELLHKKLPFSNLVYSTPNQFYEQLMSDSIKFNTNEGSDKIPAVITKIGERCVLVSSNKRIAFKELMAKIEEIIDNLPLILEEEGRRKQQFEKILTMRIGSDHNSTSTGKPCSSKGNCQQLSINTQPKRKQSEDVPNAESLQDKQFIMLLMNTYKQLYQRLLVPKRPRKQISKSLLSLCFKFLNCQQVPQPQAQGYPIQVQSKCESQTNEHINYFLPQVLNTLMQNITKLKIICQYSQQQKMISFNLQQFMLIDTLQILYQVTKVKYQQININNVSSNNNININTLENDINSKNQQNSKSMNKCIERLATHLQFQGQAKSMAYYKQLRSIICNLKQ